MGLFRRSRPDTEPAGPVDPPGDAPVAGADRTAPAAWESVAPLTTTLRPPEPTFKIGAAVKPDLVALDSPRLSSGMGHLVSNDAPAGVVAGLATLGVQRRADTDAAPVGDAAGNGGGDETAVADVTGAVGGDDAAGPRWSAPVAGDAEAGTLVARPVEAPPVESPARHLPLVLAPVQRRSDDGNGDGGAAGNGADAGVWRAPGVSPVSEPAVQRRADGGSLSPGGLSPSHDGGSGSAHSDAALGDGSGSGNGHSGSPLGAGLVTPGTGNGDAAGNGTGGGGPGVADNGAGGTPGNGGGAWTPDAGASALALDGGDHDGAAGIGTLPDSSEASATAAAEPTAVLGDAVAPDAQDPGPTGGGPEPTVSRQADLHTLIPPGTRPRGGGLGPPIELPGSGGDGAGPAVVQRSIEPAGHPTTDPAPATSLPSFPGAELPIVQRSRGPRPPGQARAVRTELVARQPDPSPELGSAPPIRRSPPDATAEATVTSGGADGGATSAAQPEVSADHDGPETVVPTLGAGASPPDLDAGLPDATTTQGAAHEAVVMPVAAIQRQPDTGVGDTTLRAGDPLGATLAGPDPSSGDAARGPAPDVDAGLRPAMPTAGTTPADPPTGDEPLSPASGAGVAPWATARGATATLPLAVQRSLAPALGNASVLGVRPRPAAAPTADVVPVPTWSTSARPEATPPTVQRWPSLGGLRDAGRGALGDALGAGRDALSGATAAGQGALRDATSVGRGALTDAIGSGRGALDNVVGAGRGALADALGIGRDSVTGLVDSAGGEARDWVSAGQDTMSGLAGGLPSLPGAGGLPSLGTPGGGALPLALPRLPGTAGDALGALGSAAGLPGAAAQAASGLVPDLGVPAVPTVGGMTDAASGVAAAASVPTTEITFPSPAEPDASPAPAATGAGGGSAAGPGGASSADLDELAGKLYDRIRWRLRSELRLDRERAGLGAGVRR